MADKTLLRYNSEQPFPVMPMNPQPLKRKGSSRTDILQPVNQPQPTRVSVAPDGQPRTVRRGNRGVRVVAVQNQWRVDDHWWTESPVSRHYWQVELITGDVVTVFLDERTG